MFLSPLLAAASLLAAQPASAPKFELKDGDRIVWIGDTLVEREQRYGYWETALHIAFPDKKFTLRNLGWSGDTVFGEARAGFDTPTQGFERLVSLTLELKPTVIFVSYGANESFAGEAGLGKFARGLEKLLDVLKPANARVVLFSPMPPIPSKGLDASPNPQREVQLTLYGTVIQKVARARNLPFADLHGTLGSRGVQAAEGNEITVNGVHLTGEGYRATTAGFLAALSISEVPATKTESQDRLRQAIVEKNQLFFYKWRPQNETYLFGFRKHEQGKNAKEVAEFDPLVAKVEAEIETIRKGLK